MKKFTSERQKIGEMGERIAEMFLVKHGFFVLERNFTCKAGEIDIICIRGKTIHFIEVKAIRVSKVFTEGMVTRETGEFHKKTMYNPFQNVSREKVLKCLRTIRFWLSSHRSLVSRGTVWQFDGISVLLSRETGRAKVEYLKNLHID